MPFSTNESLISDIRCGRMVILVDDEDRENEGDLVLAAEHVTPDAINFMARYARGLICMPLTQERCQQIGLTLMVEHSRESQGTRFTVSIDAAHGISTGISAADRARTIRTAASPTASANDFVQPGHIFPLLAESGGVLTRAGHTEAACDITRLAGLQPVAVIVEILNEDGTMARRPNLELFAEQHGLKIGTIANLIRHRLLHEKTITHVGSCRFPTEYGQFTLHGYRNSTDGALHLALAAGMVSAVEPTLVRVHIQDSLHDLTASLRNPSEWALSKALTYAGKTGDNAIVLILRYPEQDQTFIDRIQAYANEDQAPPTQAQLAAEGAADLRTYGIGAQILRDLGVRRMRVMSTPKYLHGISGFELDIVDYLYDTE